MFTSRDRRPLMLFRTYLVRTPSHYFTPSSSPLSCIAVRASLTRSLVLLPFRRVHHHILSSSLAPPILKSLHHEPPPLVYRLTASFFGPPLHHLANWTRSVIVLPLAQALDQPLTRVELTFPFPFLHFGQTQHTSTTFICPLYTRSSLHSPLTYRSRSRPRRFRFLSTLRR